MKKTIIFLTVLFSVQVFAKETIVAKVNGMVCAYCSNSLEKKFKKIDEVENINVDLDKKEVVIYLKEGQTLPFDKVKETIKKSGFKVVSVESK